MTTVCIHISGMFVLHPSSNLRMFLSIAEQTPQLLAALGVPLETLRREQEKIATREKLKVQHGSEFLLINHSVIYKLLLYAKILNA